MAPDPSSHELAPDVAEFVAARDQALLSLNRSTILAYLRKWAPEQAVALGQADKTVFWASIHKARTAAVSLPMAARSDSKFWLAQRGMRSLDDGDVPWAADA